MRRELSTEKLRIGRKTYSVIKRVYGKVAGITKYPAERKENRVLLVDTPTHGNLGDHAIVLAEQQLLQRMNIQYLELPASRINRCEKIYAMSTPANQDVLIHGGGFLGSLWPEEEYRFRRIVRAFHKNRIIVFPQTVTFDLDTEEGRAFLKESQKVYSEHPNLTIFVREKMSLSFMQEFFPTVQCTLVPDIVTLLEIPTEQEGRNGILLCLRKDKEKSLKEDDVKKMQASIRERYPEERIEFSDTVISDRNQVMPEERKKEVQKKLKQFSKSKLIITDRLHGMIFSLITGTPCVAMSNSNGKVQAVYKWIKEYEYVKFAQSVEELNQKLDEINLEKKYCYDRNLVEREFEPLLEQLGKMQQ